MWLVVTFGSPCALNIARLASRMRSRVCFAAIAAGRPSAAQLLDQVDVFLHRLVGLHAFELGPGLVFGGADEIEESRLRAGYVAIGTLLEQRVELEQGVVVGAIVKFLDVFSGLLERGFQVGHVVPRGICVRLRPWTMAKVRGRVKRVLALLSLAPALRG